MRHRHVHLQYQLQPEPQAGEAVRHALFDMLGAVQAQGSIQHAARVLGVSYRHVWGALKQWEETLGEALVVWAQGQPARLTPLAQRLLWAETRARARLAPQIDGLRAELEAVWREALEGAPRDVLTLCASPEAVWPRLREVLGRTHALHLAWQPTRSGDALHALAEGRCDLAACHVPSTPAWQAAWGQALRARLKSGRYQCIAWGRRSLVWMCAPGNPLHLQGWADVVAQRARYVNRVEGSQTRLLADLWLAQQGVAARDIVGYTEAPEAHHLAVAAAIASGAGDVGLGDAAAAARFGLHTQPVQTEEGFLVCERDALERPAVQALCAALQSPAWAEALAQIPGHSLSEHSGQALSLARAVPGGRGGR